MCFWVLVLGAGGEIEKHLYLLMITRLQLL